MSKEAGPLMQQDDNSRRFSIRLNRVLRTEGLEVGRRSFKIYGFENVRTFVIEASVLSIITKKMYFLFMKTFG